VLVLAELVVDQAGEVDEVAVHARLELQRLLRPPARQPLALLDGMCGLSPSTP
jgi:hypothetical protein